MAVGFARRARGGAARRMRSRADPPHGSGDRPLQRALPHRRARTRAGLAAHAGGGVPQGRRTLRGAERRGGDPTGRCRSGLPDGEPQPGRGDPHPDRPRSSPARGRTAIGTSRNPTTPSPPRWRRGGPIGASPSRRWRAPTASASCRSRRSITISRWSLPVAEKPRSAAFLDLLDEPETREALRALGFRPAAA